MKNSSSSSLLIFVVTSEFEYKTTACLESIPDQLLLSRMLDRLTDYATQFQELCDLIARFVPSMFEWGKFL